MDHAIQSRSELLPPQHRSVAKAAVSGCTPLDEETPEDLTSSQGGPTAPFQPLEIAEEHSSERDTMSFVPNMSPSAVAASEASRKRRLRQRWPSFSLEVSTTADIANTSFMFADQLQTQEDNLRETGLSPGKGGRRVPINILKLPWQHPFRNHESNSNPYKIPRALFAAIFLTTTLALFSAWDAQNHCISNETDALMALLGGGDDGYSGDNASQENYDDQGTDDDVYASEMLLVTATCKEMFRQVMVPVGLITGAGSLLALGILRQHQRSYGKMRDGAKVPLMAQSPPCFYSFYLPLLFVSGLILAAWTVGIVLVMLRPRSNDSDNPYTSLAAVDAMGRVGDNANLYYLSWISELLAMLIFYLLGGAFVRQHWLPMITAPAAGTMSAAPPVTSNPSTVSAASSAFLHIQKHALAGSHMISTKGSMDNSLLQFSSVSSMPGAIPATTQRYHSSRIKWYQTFYKLRVRTGIWVAALFCSLVIVASSAHLFHEVLLPAALSLYDDDDYLSTNDRISWWNVVEENKAYGRVCVVLANQDSNLSEALCKRTFFSLLSGFVAVILCGTAIVLHLLARRSAAADALYVEACGGVYHELALEMMVTKNHHFPLRTELLLSVVLSLWLGWNALCVSSIHGPASRVGNLYYGSWLCFLLCLRISLGCVEEYFNIDNDEGGNHEQKHNSRRYSRQPSYRAPSLARETEGETNPASASDNGNGAKSHRQTNQQGQNDESKDALEKERASRLRRYFFLFAFSTVCAGSAIDAAANQGFALSLSEKYMILAPTTVALVSAAMFLLCLFKESYAIVSRFWCGGVLSLVCFEVWLLDLVLTMHSKDSWAVNGVGEIEMANLYYFSWASIITAGIQMTSYFQEALGLESEDYMSVVWAAIGKVCFVILGAALHIWHSISDQCDIEFRNSALTFCSRTVLAMIIAATGITISGTVVFIRVLVPTRFLSTRSRAHCEAVTSIFLMLLYGVGTAMVTGIGSPGQSVGDLYYSTWLAFIVSIGIFISCYDQIKVAELEAKESESMRESFSTDGVLA
ncbi:expressed unknown protein [Seminavis robusta]|uniref:Uncharacterized protein n=1 Tax=Seminavis robusta TaxID=568900 RepID=A0A9N8HDD7_9STRA|nr:expressed unknown protein [Seminavis robusta]|eukprot:Sro423_g139740.1 n/a (1035) ;mRNA; r:8897-12001